MIKKTLLFLASILFVSSLFAGNVVKSDAERVAKNHYYKVASTSDYNAIAIVETFEIKRNGTTVYYAFDFSEGGFVIVSADDSYKPIIGYSLEGSYPQGDVPPNWEDYMNRFADMILYVKENNVEATPEFASQWDYLSTENPAAIEKSREAIALISTALWNQDYPYNYFCPLDAQGNGGRVYAGCVATAMSIIMYYWRWPLQGEGAYSYKPTGCNKSYPTQSANFGETTYHFEGMVHASDVEVNEPIALLMYHCGVSVDMMYCHSASGAYSDDVLRAIKKYFRYSSTAKYLNRRHYEDNEWIDILKGDIDKKQPLYYDGFSNSGGHAFVCDGYDSDDLFHYNFGWSGSGNGFYSIDDVNGFSWGCNVIADFIPNREEGYPAYATGETTLTFGSGTITDGSGPTDNYQAGTIASWLLDRRTIGDMTEYTISFEMEEISLAEGDWVKIYDGVNNEATLLAEYSSSNNPGRVTTTGQAGYVEFYAAPDSPTGEGFLLNYVVNTIRECFGNTTEFYESSGSFSDGSKEEFHYPNRSQCYWIIAPREKKGAVTITFDYLETEPENDIVAIYDLTTENLIKQYSGICCDMTVINTEIPNNILTGIDFHIVEKRCYL